MSHYTVLLIVWLLSPPAGTGWAGPLSISGDVDRVEGGTAVVLVDDGEGGFRQLFLPLAPPWVPPGVQAGDQLREGRIDEAARAASEARIRRLQSRAQRPPDGVLRLDLD